MYSQRHIDRQDIHAVGGVEGDLSNRLADDGCKVRIIGKTITQITFYAADGVYVLPVSVAL